MVETASSPDGPWLRRCGPTTNLAPKLCRVTSLQPGHDAWFRVSVTDPDGVGGPAVQLVGPIQFDGLENLAFGRPVTADPGWGCCPDPKTLTDGVIQGAAWNNGFAVVGGLKHWGNGNSGWKQAVIDLGRVATIGRVDIFYHQSDVVPLHWRVEVSRDDGKTFTEVYSAAAPMCRAHD